MFHCVIASTLVHQTYHLFVWVGTLIAQTYAKTFYCHQCSIRGENHSYHTHQHHDQHHHIVLFPFHSMMRIFYTQSAKRISEKRQEERIAILKNTFPFTLLHTFTAVRGKTWLVSHRLLGSGGRYGGSVDDDGVQCKSTIQP